ncbi:hypothetical protein GN956_G11923 [Arapaima gigas]
MEGGLKAPRGPLWRSGQPSGVVRSITPLLHTQTKVKMERMKDAVLHFTTATTHGDKSTTRLEQQEQEKDALLVVARVRNPAPPLNHTELLLFKPNCAVEPGGSQARCWMTRSHLAGLTRKEQLRMMQELEQHVLKKWDLWEPVWMSSSREAKRLERRLEKELQKLRGEEQLSRERLQVFSALLEDLCCRSHVFGDSLREIKREYDLYLNSLGSTSDLMPDQMDTLGCVGSGVAGMQELEEARKEVSRLTEEVRGALEENNRVRQEIQSLQGQTPEDKGVCRETVQDRQKLKECPAYSVAQVQLRAHQVWRMWEEVQNLKKEMKEEMVPKVTVSVTEQRIRESKADIRKLLKSNRHLQKGNKNAERDISAVFTRSKAKDEMKEELWDKIWTALGHGDR